MVSTLLLATWIAVGGQVTQPKYLWVAHTGSDSGGIRLVYETKEILRTARGVRFVDASSDRALSAQSYFLAVLSIPVSISGQEMGSAVSLVLLRPDYRFITNWIYTIDPTKDVNVKRLAAEIVANIDNALAKYAK